MDLNHFDFTLRSSAVKTVKANIAWDAWNLFNWCSTCKFRVIRYCGNNEKPMKAD